MATYLEIKGVKVQSLAADTTVEGQVWYNTATYLLKFYNGTSAQTVTVS
jgi:hypothetical protein